MYIDPIIIFSQILYSRPPFLCVNKIRSALDLSPLKCLVILEQRRFFKWCNIAIFYEPIDLFWEFLAFICPEVSFSLAEISKTHSIHVGRYIFVPEWSDAHFNKILYLGEWLNFLWRKITMKGLSVISRGQNELKFVSFLTEKTSQIQNSFTEGSTSFKWLHIMIRLGYQVNIWPNSCKITLKSANQKNKDFLVKTHFVPQDKSSCTTPLFVLLRVSLAIFSCHNIYDW